MNNQEYVQLIDSGDIDLGKLFGLLWKRKTHILIVTIVVAALSVLASYLVTEQYQSSAILVERNSSGNSPLSEFSGIASITGINLPTMSDNNRTDIAVEKIKSRAFLRELIKHKGFAPKLLAADGYNPTSKEMSFDRDMFDPDTGKWSSNYFAAGEPSYLYAHEIYLKKFNNK